jgi:hypothetical protein
MPSKSKKKKPVIGSPQPAPEAAGSYSRHLRKKAPKTRKVAGGSYMQ